MSDAQFRAMVTGLDAVETALHGPGPEDHDTRSSPMFCPACNGEKHVHVERSVYRCETCGAIHGAVTPEELRHYVGRSWCITDPPHEKWQYVDVTVQYQHEKGRWHGWVDADTRELIQSG